jgi:hypothetical protein
MRKDSFIGWGLGEPPPTVILLLPFERYSSVLRPRHSAWAGSTATRNELIAMANSTIVERFSADKRILDSITAAVTAALDAGGPTGAHRAGDRRRPLPVYRILPGDARTKRR